MARDKKIKNLAADTPDADTTELRVLSVDMIPTAEELEADAATCSLEEEREAANDVESLKSDLRSRDERISSLQFDIEQLRSRWTSLEKEIKAREELTAMLQSDLKASHKRLNKRDARIKKLEQKNDSLSRRLESVDDDGRDAVTSETLEALERQIEELNEQRARDADRILSLEEDLEAHQFDQTVATDRDVAPAEDSGGDASQWETRYHARGDEIAQLRREFTRNSDALRDALSRRGRLDAMLQVARSENADLKSRLNSATQTIKGMDGEQRENRERLSLHEGLVADLGERLRDAVQRLESSEGYADGLRRRLAGIDEQQADALAQIEVLTDELSATRETAAATEGELSSARETIAELEEQLRNQKVEFDQEIATLRFELGEAQETISTQDTVNEKLASTVVEQESAEESLKRRLERLEAERDSELKTLKHAKRRLETSLEELEEKLSNKDNAISALLNELASKSRSLDSIGEIESVIQEIDGRMSERFEEESGDRERPTRLLVGAIDGQELRFPLFKDRLTIGRTGQNDIQLRAQYISRRHAVIIVEDDITRIIDWGSKNGVYVNNARISEQVLANGDLVSIGAADFMYEERPRREQG